MSRDAWALCVFAYLSAGIIIGMVIGVLLPSRMAARDQAAIVVSGGLLWPVTMLIAVVRAAWLCAGMVRPRRRVTVDAGIPAARVVRE